MKVHSAWQAWDFVALKQKLSDVERVWSVKCAVESVECEVWSMKCEVWSGGVQSVECEVWSVKCGV